MGQQKSLFRVVVETLAVLGVIFTPKVAASATLEFFNKSFQRLAFDVWDLGAVGIAATLLLITIALTFWFKAKRVDDLGGIVWVPFKTRDELGSTLAVILMVFSAICLVGGLGIGEFGLTFLGRTCLSVTGLVGMMLVRGSFRPAVSWGQLMFEYESKRFSAIIFLFCWLHVAGGGIFVSVSAKILVSLMVLPWLANWSRLPIFLRYLPEKPTEIPGAKSFAGTSRWIFAFVAGGTGIGVLTGQFDGIWLGASLFFYLLAFLCEWPKAKLLTEELCSVAGSGAATALHLMLMNRDLMNELAWGRKVLLVSVFLGCLGYVCWVVWGGVLPTLQFRKQEEGAG